MNTFAVVFINSWIDFLNPSSVTFLENIVMINANSARIAAAERSGVKFIAYTSLANTQESTNLFAPTHKATEKAIKKTGISYSFLRNNWYLENEISSIQGVLAGAPWVTSVGNGKVGWALQQDYAEAAAAVLSNIAHENTIYELSGSFCLRRNLFFVLGVILGKEVPVQQIDDSNYTEIMKSAGLPDFVVTILVDIQRSIPEGS